MLQIILGPHQPNETPSSLRPDNGALFDAKAWRSCHRITLPFAKVKQARISAPYTRAHTSTHAHAYTNTNTRTNMQARTLFRTYARMCTCTRHRLLRLTLLRAACMQPARQRHTTHPPPLVALAQIREKLSTQPTINDIILAALCAALAQYQKEQKDPSATDPRAVVRAFCAFSMPDSKVWPRPAPPFLRRARPNVRAQSK